MDKMIKLFKVKNIQNIKHFFRALILKRHLIVPLGKHLNDSNLQSEGNSIF